MTQRFIIQQSTTPGWWVATDTEHGIVVKVREHLFNGTQKWTVLNEDNINSQEELLKHATYSRELSDWLRANHYNKIF